MMKKGITVIALLILLSLCAGWACAAASEELVEADDAILENEAAPSSEPADELMPADADGSADNTAKQAVRPSKDETVYITLNADGSVDSVSVVNRIDVKDGVASDYGTYQGITNMTDESVPQTGEGSIIFRLADAEAASLYYEGIMSPESELPFLFDISYTLDGKAVDSGVLAGASGRVGITLDVRRNANVNDYFNNMMLQISLSLDMTKCRNVVAPGASSVLVGKTLTLAYTFLMGDSQTYTAEFDSVDFSMDSIRMTGLKQTDMLGAGAFSIADAEGNPVSVEDGITMLRDGTAQASTGSMLLYFGMEQFAARLSALSRTAQELSDQYPDDEGAARLRDDASALVETQGQISKNFQTLANGLKLLAESVDTLSLQAGDLLGLLGGGEAEGAPVSFAAPGMVTPYSVQFIYQTRIISPTDVKEEYTEAPEVEKTFWERLSGLFSGE